MAEGFKIGSAYIEILLEEMRARQAASRLGRDISGALPDHTVKIDADIDRATAQLNKVNAKLNDLRSRRTTPEVDLEIADAEAKARQIEARIQGLRDKRVKVDADTGDSDTRIRRVSSGLSGLRDRNVRVVVNTAGSIAALGALTSAAGIAAAALSALPGIAAAAGGGIGVLLGSFSGVGDALKGYAADQDAAAAAGGRAAGAAQSNARQIRDAQQAVDDARRNAARIARDSSEQVQDAVRNEARVARQAAEAVADAKEDQQRVAEQVADAIQDAEEDAADAAERGAERMRDAARRVEDALRDERDAQEALTQAREDAARALDDLQERVSDYALDEEGAQLRIERARERLAETNADASASDLDKREAAHDLAEAEERLSDIQRERAEKTAELADAEAKGVDGSEQVVDAQERVADAHDRVLEAQREQAQTAKDVAEANQEAQERIADAVRDGARAQADAAERVADAVRDGEESKQDAARETARARRDAAEAEADANRAVQDALEGLKDAQDAANESIGGGGAGAISKYAQAMAKLNPYQRELVEQLLAMQPLVEKLKFAASETFLPGFIQMLRDSEGLFPIFEGHVRRTGEIMGDTARQFGDLFKNQQFKNNLDAMFRNSDVITRAIGDSFVRLTGRIVQFGAETDRSAAGFAGFVGSVTTGLEGFFDKLAEHDASFERVWEALGRIAEVVLPAVGEAIGKIADVLGPVLENVADFLERHKDSIDEVLLGLAALFVALKAAKLVSAVSGWTSSVIGFIDKIGGASKRNKGQVDDLLDSLDPNSKKNKGRKFGQFGGLGAGFLATYALEGGLKTVEPGMPGYEEHQKEYRPRIESHGMNPDDPQFQSSAFDRWTQDLQPKLDSFKQWWNDFWSPEGSLNSPLYQWGQDVLAWWNGLWGENGTIMTTIRGWGSSILGWWDTTKASAIQKMTEWRDGAVAKATEIVNGISTWIQQLPGRVAAWFTSMRDQAVAKLTEWKDAAVQKATEIVNGISQWIQQLPGRVQQWFTDMRNRAVQWLTDLVTNARTKAGEIVDSITQWLQQLPGRALQWFEGMRSSAVQKATELVNWVRGIPGMIMGALGNLGTLLLESGRSLVNGFLNGIKNAWGTLTSWVRQGMANLRALWPFSPAKEGPFSGRGYVTYSGKALTGDFAESLRKGMPGVIASARAVMDGARNELGLPSGMPGSASLGSSQGPLNARQAFALDRLVSLMEQDARDRLRRTQGDVHVHLEQTSGSPAETGRFVALALRGVG